MQWGEFKYFVGKILMEGRRLQKVDIAGRMTTRRKLTQTQVAGIIMAVVLYWILPQGINDNFAEYAIAFLGIFVGLFTSIIISLYDKAEGLYENFDNKTSKEKARIEMVRNYLVQFTGLTAYSIVLALMAVVLLLGILLFPNARVNINDYHWVRSWSQVNFYTTGTFVRLAIVSVFRVGLLYLLMNFFFVTLFSLSSYFSFLLSEYKKLGITTDEEKDN